MRSDIQKEHGKGKESSWMPRVYVDKGGFLPESPFGAKKQLWKMDSLIGNDQRKTWVKWTISVPHAKKSTENSGVVANETEQSIFFSSTVFKKVETFAREGDSPVATHEKNY